MRIVLCGLVPLLMLPCFAQTYPALKDLRAGIAQVDSTALVTLFPLCGRGSGTQATICSKGPTTAISLGADPTSFVYVPLICDAREVPVLSSPRGQYEYSTTPSGTDNTATMAFSLAASNVTVSTGAAAPIGASAEYEAHTTFRRVVVLPDGCNYRLATWPPLRGIDGIKIKGNRSSGYVTSTSGNGPVFQSMDTGNTSGSNNNSIEDLRMVYVGGHPGTSTGNCAGFIGGGHNQMHGVSCFGFNLGIVSAGNEYSDFSDSYTAWNNIGVANLPASFSTVVNGVQVPSQIAGNGTPSLDNHFTGITSVFNRVTNWLFNGSNTNTVRGGSSSNGGMADVVFGAIDAPYLDTITISNAHLAMCSPNSTVPLKISGGNPTLPAFAALQVDASGHPIGARVSNGSTMMDAAGGFVIPTVNGGKGFTSTPKVTAPACKIPPGLTAHVQAWTGILPFAGDASGDGVNLTGAGQNIFEENDLENEGAVVTRLNRNSSGFQFLEDVSANTNTIRNNTIGIGGNYEYQHVFRDEGLGNRHLDTNVSDQADPITAATCSGVATQEGEVGVLSGILDPENQVCNANDSVNTASRFVGWDGSLIKSRGISVVGSGANPATVQLVTTGSTPMGGILGISATPGSGYYSPAPTMTGFRNGVPEPTGTFISADLNPPLTTQFVGDGVAGSNKIAIVSIPDDPYYIAVNSLLAGPGVRDGTRVTRNVGGELTVSQPLTVTRRGSKFVTTPVGQLGSKGIPAQSSCVYAYHWNGGGSGPTTWTFNVNAACDGAFYSSQGQISGQEKYSLAGVVANTFTGNLYTPASSTAIACDPGLFFDDANYHYVCVAKNTLKRVALSAF